jgi:hypothetical protein
MTSAFETWFIEQHGARENRDRGNRCDMELQSMVTTGKHAEIELARRELWDEKRQSALYAWTASKEAV